MGGRGWLVVNTAIEHKTGGGQDLLPLPQLLIWMRGSHWGLSQVNPQQSWEGWGHCGHLHAKWVPAARGTQWVTQYWKMEEPYPVSWSSSKNCQRSRLSGVKTGAVFVPSSFLIA